MNEVEQLCKRIAFIYRGQIIDIGTIKKMKLKKFSTYDIVIHVKEIKIELLEKNNIKIEGNKTLRTTISYGQNISEILNLLNKNGFQITDVETIKPSLENYFVKIVDDNNEH